MREIAQRHCFRDHQASRTAQLDQSKHSLHACSIGPLVTFTDMLPRS